MDSVLGWKTAKLPQSEVKEVLQESKSHSIALTKALETIYQLRDFPALSVQEEMLVKNIFELFLESKKDEKNSKGIIQSIHNYCERNFVELESEQKEYILRVLELMVFGFGPVSCLLENNLIEEISVIGTGENKPVFVFEKNFGWLKTNLFFCDEQAVKNLANKMARAAGRHLSLQHPMLNAFLPDGSRLNACIDPVSTEPVMTIRKFRQTPFTPLELVENGTVCADAMAFLWLAMQSEVSALVCGNTGSGKTTTLNALFCLIPKTERIVVTEETPEINLVQEHVVKLKTVQNIGVEMTDLIVNTFRMRPDRVIVGEIRDANEVNAFVNTLLSGQAKGSFATFHAKSASEALTRMKKLGVLEIDLSALDLVIVQKRWTKIDAKKNTRKEQRRVTEIAEVVNSDGLIELNRLFEFNQSKGRLERTGQSVKVIEKIQATFGFDKKGVESALRKKTVFIEKNAPKEISLSRFFELVNNGSV